jgi:2-oxoglutarate ferredoxin oxidoreductase subunit alpha
MSQLTLDAVKPFGLGNKEALRCKNMWTLGLALWMFDRDRQPIVDWLKAKFAKAPTLAEANIAALNAGHAYGETAELSGFLKQHHISAAPAEPGLYRTVPGAESISLGLVAGTQLAGLPTKTEQSDLYHAVYGRNADAPLPVIAARSPADAFDCAIEAVRIATQFMTPVMLLTDGYIANAAEPWRVPDMSRYAPFPVQFLETVPEGGFQAYARDDKLARPWVKPGTPGLLHRIGGIEKQAGTGNIDYSPGNHQLMTDMRAAKVLGIADHIPEQEVTLGETSGKLAVVGWGSTYGAIHQAVRRQRMKGHDVHHIHVRHIWPLPKNLGVLLRSYERIIVPEMNTGQFKTVLRDQFLVDAQPLNKVSGQPFRISEIEAAIERALV